MIKFLLAFWTWLVTLSLITFSMVSGVVFGSNSKALATSSVAAFVLELVNQAIALEAAFSASCSVEICFVIL